MRSALELMQPWVNAQRIGVAAYVAGQAYRAWQTDPEAGEQFFGFQEALVSSLHKHLGPVNDAADQLGRVMTLPPTVLNLLDWMFASVSRELHEQVLQQDLAALEPLVRDALVRLEDVAGVDGSALGQAEVLASHLLDSGASAERILRLGEALCPHSHDRGVLRNAWRRLAADGAATGRVKSALKALRDPAGDTETRLRAVAALGNVLGRTPHWPQVEDQLFTQVFCWPLLVARTADDTAREDPDRFAVSLPVAVDLVFDGRPGRGAEVGKGQDAPGGDRLPDGHSPGGQGHRLAGATRACRRSGDGAVAGDAPELLRAEAQDRSRERGVRFPSPAEIVQGIVRPRLEDRSAEAYFAMSVLARFLGQRGFFASAVTGQIGNPARVPITVCRGTTMSSMSRPFRRSYAMCSPLALSSG